VSERQALAIPARLMWKDARGAMRFASAVTRDISEQGLFVECTTPAVIPLYRLVQVQIDREGRDCGVIPKALREGKVLAAVYRVGPYRRSTGAPAGYALRLMIEPERIAARHEAIA
jgi:hypothetical protein